MKYKLKVYTIWELGARSNQEDAMFPRHGKACDNDRTFILCDGMGGHSAGEVASQAVCEAMGAWITGHCPDAEGDFSDADFHFQQNHFQFPPAVGILQIVQQRCFNALSHLKNTAFTRFLYGFSNR